MNFEEIKKLVNELASDLMSQKSNKNSFKRTINTGDIKGVIDVSFDDEVKIPKEDFAEKPLIKDYRYWILKLDRYYKNSAMRVGQMNVASLKMYAKLCDRLEAELNKEGTTVARLVSRLRKETVNYDIYYTLYRIAETSVINFYNPLSAKSYEKSLQILENNTTTKIRKIIENEAIRLTKSLRPPEQETREFYGLTENNKVSLWWDPDGSIREKYGYSQAEELAVNQISKRMNVLWRNDRVRGLMLDMYLATVKAIFDNPDIDSKNILSVVKPYNFSKETLDNLIIVSEAKIRDQFFFYNTISTDKALEQLHQIQEDKLLEFVYDFQDRFIENLTDETLNDIYTVHFKKNPDKTKDMVRFIKTKDLSQQIEILEKYQDHENFYKIMDELVKEDDTNLKLMGLYYLYKEGKAEKKDENILLKIILEENLGDFLELVENNDLSLDLLAEIKKLKAPKPKKIKVDSKKISDSRKELRETVDTLNKFFEEDGEIDQADEKVNQVSSDKSFEYKEILEEILSNGYMDMDQVENLAKKSGQTTNNLIGQINESLFDYIGDQTLLVEADKLVIDEFYVDMIKEYINGN